MTTTIQQIVAVLRKNNGRIQNNRGPKRAHRAGLHITTWKGNPYKGLAAIIPGMDGKFTMDEMKEWYLQAKQILISEGFQVLELYGPDALSCVILNG